MTFAFAARILAIVCAGLFVILAVFPQFYTPAYGVAAGDEVQFMARRASPMFLGVAVILWIVAKAPHSNLREGVTLGVVVIFLGVAITGCLAFINGVATPTILIAAAFECLGACVIWAMRKN